MILTIIHNLFCRTKPESNSVVKVSLCVEALESSYLPREITNVMLLNVDANYYELLVVVEDIVQLSKSSCIKLLDYAMIDALLLHLTEKQVESELSTCFKVHCLDITLRILWQLLKQCQITEHYKKIEPPKKEAIENLMIVLKKATLQEAQSVDSKFSRNNIVAILLQLIYLFPKMDLQNIHLDLFSLGRGTKKGTQGTWIDSIQFGNDTYDFSLTRFMLFGIYLLVEDTPKCIFEKLNTMELLLNFLTPWDNSENLISWTPSQSNELLIIVLKILPSLVPYLLEQFLSSDGPQRLMQLLDLFRYEMMCLDILLVTVDCLHRISRYAQKMEDPDFLKILQTNIDTLFLIKLCRRILNSEALSLVYQKLLTHLMCIIQLLLENSAQTTVDPTELLNISSTCLNRLKNPNEGDSLTSNRLLLSVADFAWEFIVYCPENYKDFVHNNGIYLILDLIQIVEHPIKIIYLSMLADACEYPVSVPYMVTWRSRTEEKGLPVGSSVLCMLCHLWRTEEERHGVKRDTNGCIKDWEQPLMGRQQAELCRQIEPNGSTAMLDMLGDMRPKIYSIVYQLVERHKDVALISEEQYRLNHLTLSSRDEITFKLIQAYFSLKAGEVWQELDGNCALRRSFHTVTPLYRDVVHNLAMRHLYLAQSVQRDQYEIVKKEEEKIMSETESLISLHNTSQLAPAVKALREMCYNARIENKEFLLEAKKKRMDNIEKCRNEFGIMYSKPTYPEALDITTMTAGREAIMMFSPKSDGRSSMKNNGHYELSQSLLNFPVSPNSSAESVTYLVSDCYKDQMKEESFCNIENFKPYPDQPKINKRHIRCFKEKV